MKTDDVLKLDDRSEKNKTIITKILKKILSMEGETIHNFALAIHIDNLAIEIRKYCKVAGLNIVFPLYVYNSCEEQNKYTAYTYIKNEKVKTIEAYTFWMLVQKCLIHVYVEAKKVK